MKNKSTIFLSMLILLGLFLTANFLPGKNFSAKNNITKNLNVNQPRYQPGQIRVKFKPQAMSLNFINQNLQITGIPSVDEKLFRFQVQSIKKAFVHKPILNNSNLPDIARIYTLYFDEEKDVQPMASAFASDPNIEYAEPIPIYYLDIAPNDPQYSSQHHLPQIHMPDAWDVARGDSNIIIAIVDGGTDWEHSDLIDNIWTNKKEAKGIVGVDDDGNGFVDDIHGWDFGENDNNPTHQPSTLEAFYHGTVTAGLASARTNNGSMVAGVSWNCTIMPLKHGRDNVERAIYDWDEGAIYAAENGASIINMSFGSFHEPYQSEQDVIDYVYSLGALIVAAAGNTMTTDPHYPSGYPHVLSVTWVDNNDILLNRGEGGSSAYGLTVDISAPGVELLSLNPDNKVIRMSGSSSAAPVVSGLAGLVKSQHPDWGPLQIMRQIVLTADNIDHLNPAYAGQIGSGRVNGYRAVSEANPPEIAPRIKSVAVSFSDSIGGDNDHIFERGETVAVSASYRNFSTSPGINVYFTLSSNDSDLTMSQSKYQYGHFPPDTTVSMPVPFTFKVNNHARGKTAQIYVGWQAEDGYMGADTFNVIVGKIPILIVDDDFDENQGNDYFPNSEKMYTRVLDIFHLNYALWDRHILGVLGPDQLANFPIVIWLCGWAFPSLDNADQLAISNFLDKGGSLFITGQDIGWDFNDPGGYGYQQRDFYAKYLHAIYYSDDSPVNQVVGLPGDPIGNGLTFTAWQPGLTAENQYPDEIEPDLAATAIFEYAGGKNHKFGIKYKGVHKVVYFGMGLEAIDSKETSLPDDISPIRTEVFSRVLNWLNFIDHLPISDTENLTDPKPIMAQVTNRFVDADLVGLELYWRKKDETLFNKLSMTNIGNNQYRAEIPGPAKSTMIEYYIKMVNTYYDWNSPQEAPKTLYSYYVGPDTIKPIFGYFPIKSTINGEENKLVSVNIKDNTGIDTTNIWVHYASKSIIDSTRLMITSENPEQFQGDLPPVFAYGDTISYNFTAYDKAKTPNRGQSALSSFIVGYEDFESGVDYWNAPPDGWGLDNAFAHSGQYSINDSPKQSSYPNNRDVIIATNFGIDLSGAQHAALKFWTKVYLEINHDYGYVEASKDGGITWNQVGSALNGFVTQWKQQIVSLSSYCGPGNMDVRLRFRMISDANQGPPLPGWFIDDVQIIEGLNITEVTEKILTIPPKEFELYQNYPNPFNPNTTIRFDLPVAGEVSVQIFNVKGELVRSLLQKYMKAGSYDFQWNGEDDKGQSLSSGMYFYKLSTNHFHATRKLLLLK